MMESRARVAEPTTDQPQTSLRAPPGPPAVETRAAANEEPETTKRRTAENPLWAINVAMGAFFIVTALVLMLS